MPSTSEKQAKFMRAAAHDPKFAQRNGIPQSTARDFVKADAAKGKPKPPKKSQADQAKTRYGK